MTALRASCHKRIYGDNNQTYFLGKARRVEWRFVQNPAGSKLCEINCGWDQVEALAFVEAVVTGPAGPSQIRLVHW